MLTQQNMEQIEFLSGNKDMLIKASSKAALPTWSEKTVDFLSAFSRNLLYHKRSHGFPDIMSYAFWIRRASLKQIKEHYYPKVENKIGRGVAFHIAPSNVPINFAVSFTSALLAGNISIVRLSNKEFEQVDIIIEALKETFRNGMADMENYLLLIRYGHNTEITSYLSSLCDIRIIWGGNQTIYNIRQTALLPRAIEMAFADRHSMAWICTEAILKADIEKLAKDFYTDTYYIDQNACSSPRIIIWFGENIKEAKEKFWAAIEKLARKDYTMKPIQAVDKLEQFCCLAARYQNVYKENNSNRVMRIQVGQLDARLMDYKLGGGYFFEYHAKNMEEIIPIMDKPCQTISYFGIEPHKIQQFIITYGLRGGDRIVPIGKTMDLSFKWDGFDMVETMSRYVYCPDYL